MNVIDQIVKDSVKKGEFDNLPGLGKPMEVDTMDEVPESRRMELKILKNSGVLPEEVLINKELQKLRQKYSEGKLSAEERDKTIKRIRELESLFNLKLERMK